MLVDKVFRGKHFEKQLWIERAAYKADYKLLSKKEEDSYCTIANREEATISPYMELPPLLKEFVMKETGQSDIKMKVQHKTKQYSNARLAKEGEKATVEAVMGIGKPHPTAKSLYEGLNI